MSATGHDADAGGCARETHLASWFAALVVSAKISRFAYISSIAISSISLSDVFVPIHGEVHIVAWASNILNSVIQTFTDFFIPISMWQGDDLDMKPAVPEDAKERLRAEMAGRRPIGSRVVVEDNGMRIGCPDNDVVDAVCGARLERFWTSTSVS
jgi:hypothetical protein